MATKRKGRKRQPDFMQYAGVMSGPADLSSRRGFQKGPNDSVRPSPGKLAVDKKKRDSGRLD